ncbi:hypothetical protein FB451DRAFT_1389518 [Mycena latifolia]|nr:hypothetical protein FB451DRAFT_1389518 [Mycena latifolia]
MSVIVDDRDGQVQYHGLWEHHSGTAPEYQSTTSASATPGDSVTFTFEGTSIDVFGTAGPGNGGTMKFSIDQSPNSSYTAPATEVALYHQLFWTSGLLSDGSHTLLITHMSLPGNQTGKIFLDYILYNTTSTAGKTLFVDDSDAHAEYSLGWNTTGGNGNFKQAAHLSTSAGSSVSLAFEGNFVSASGPVFFGTKGEGFNASVAIDGGSPSPITQSHLSQVGQTTFNNILFTTSNLAPGNHTIVVTALDNHPFGVDYFLFGGPTNTSGAITSAPPIPSSTQSAPPANFPPSQNLRSSNVPAIIGGALGGLVFVALVVAGLFKFLRRRRGRSFTRLGRRTHIIPGWVQRRATASSGTTVLSVEGPDSESATRLAVDPFLLRLAKQRESTPPRPESPPPQYLSNPPSLSDHLPDD